MKILFVLHQFLPDHQAGTELYTYHLARALRDRGHDIHLFFTEIRHDRVLYEVRTGDLDGLSFHEVVNNGYEVTFRWLYKDPEMEVVFRDVLDAVRPDLVHIQHLAKHSIGYLDELARRALPTVYTLHEYLLMCPYGGRLLRPDFELCDGPRDERCAECVADYPPPLDPARSMVDAVALRRSEIQRCLGQVDLFISPSAFLRDKFVQNGWIPPDRIIHSDNGLIVEPYAGIERVPAERLRFGYVGTIADYKGIELIVQAFRGLDAATVECRIYGDTGYFPEYEAKLRSLQKPACLSFTGRFENARIAHVLAELDVLIVPSLWFENSPLTIHEAFLAGIPVICSDRGGMAELVEHEKTGLWFRLGDARDLRRQILRLVEEPALRESLRQSFPHVKSIEEDAEMMEERYRVLLEQRGWRAVE